MPFDPHTFQMYMHYFSWTGKAVLCSCFGRCFSLWYLMRCRSIRSRILSMVSVLSVANSLYVRRNESFLYAEITYDLIGIVMTLFVVEASLIEGYGVSWKASFLFGLLLSTIFSWRSITFTWLADEDLYPERELELWSGMSIGLMSYMAGSYRVLSLFLWKQTIFAAWCRGEWCICIFLSPQIKWTDNDSVEGNDEKALGQELQHTSSSATQRWWSLNTNCIMLSVQDTSLFYVVWMHQKQLQHQEFNKV